MPHPNMPPPNNMLDHLNHPDFSPHFNIFRGVFIYFIVFVISVGLKMTNEWFKNDRQKKELENDKLTAELAMLKAQLNPHFFFNVLNNLCSLARSKSDDTETYIIKLSQLMRYNLYNQKEEKVSLIKEIQFIEDYIDIQKMRVVDSVEIIFNKTGDMNQSLIAPMILFPFVENAFKHGISYNENSKIEIDLKVDHDQLMFSVSNYIFRPKGEEPTKKHAGIGLQNVLKRLNIQYKDKYKISIKNDDFSFSVKLKLELK
jgi:LytS/YehU family sensor histidine kinase